MKESVDTLLGLISTNAELEDEERPVKDVCLNRVFLGNPGTGKYVCVFVCMALCLWVYVCARACVYGC